MSYTGADSSPVAISLRVADVRRAAAFYQQIGFRQVMAVPDESDEWLLCLLRYGNASILLGALDNQRFPRMTGHRHSSIAGRDRGVRVTLDVSELALTYAACLRAGCQIMHGSWGAQSFCCVDPFGHEWEFTQSAQSLGAHVHDVGYDDRMALACQCAAIAALIR